MSASGVFGPAPEGIDLSKTQNAPIRNAVVSLMVIGTVFVGLRLVARRMQKAASLGLDDFCIILGLIFAHGTAICSLVSLPYGGGKHLWVLTAAEFTTIWQILFAYVMIYACAVTFTKLSIVLFYRRIFGMNWGLWICMFLVISYCFVVIVTICLACTPLPYFWTQYTTPGAKGHCINVPLFFFANGIWAMLVDICILVVPIPIILKLQMPRGQKTTVLMILLLGGFVCIASVVRITTIHRVITSVDLTWAMGQLFIWSCCEPFIGIVCACLPTLAPFFRRWWKTVGTRTPRSSEQKSGNLGSKNVYSGNNLTDHNTSSTGGFRSKTKREWNRLNSDTKLRGDDEVELTNKITGPGSLRTKGSDDGSSARYPGSDILVKTDVTWTTAHLDTN